MKHFCNKLIVLEIIVATLILPNTYASTQDKETTHAAHLTVMRGDNQYFPCPITEAIMRQYDKGKGKFSFLDVSGIFKGNVDSKCPNTFSGFSSDKFEESISGNKELSVGISLNLSRSCAKIPQLSANNQFVEEVIAGSNVALKRFDLGMKGALEGIASIDSILGDTSTVNDEICNAGSALPEVVRWCRDIQANCADKKTEEFEIMTRSTEKVMNAFERIAREIEDPFGDVSKFNSIDLQADAEKWMKTINPNERVDDWGEIRKIVFNSAKKSINGGKGIRTCETEADLGSRKSGDLYTDTLKDNFRLRVDNTLTYERLTPEEKKKCDLLASAQQVALKLAPWVVDESFGIVPGRSGSAYAVRVDPLKAGGSKLKSYYSDFGSNTVAIKSALSNRLKKTRSALLRAYGNFANGAGCLLGKECFKGLSKAWDNTKKVALNYSSPASLLSNGAISLKDDSLDKYNVVQEALKDAPLLNFESISGIDQAQKNALAAAQCRQSERYKAKGVNDFWVDAGVSLTLMAATLGSGTVIRAAATGARFASAAEMISVASNLQKVGTIAKTTTMALSAADAIWAVPAVSSAVGKCNVSGLEAPVVSPLSYSPYCSQLKSMGTSSHSTKVSLLRDCLLNGVVNAIPALGGAAIGVKLLK